MKDSIRQVHALASLELIRIARSPATIIALASFTILLAIGHWLHWRALPPRPDDDRLFGYAFLVAVMIGLRFGFASDRESGTEQLLIGNLIRPATYFFGKAAALLITLLAFMTYAGITSGLLSVGDWSYSLWYALLFALVIWLFTPLMLLFELALDTRYPGPAVFVTFVIMITIARFTIGIQPLIDLLAFDRARLDFAGLLPLAWRALIVAGVTGLLYPVWRWRMIGRITTSSWPH